MTKHLTDVPKNIGKFLSAIGSGTASEELAAKCVECGTDTTTSTIIPETFRHFSICRPCLDKQHREVRAQLIDAQRHNPEDLIQRSGIPSLPRFPLSRLFERFLDADDKIGLFVFSEPGTGKSTQAVEFVRRWCEDKRKPAMYVHEVGLFQALKNWSENTDVYNRLTTCPLLVIDDLGTSKSSEWADSMLYAVIDARSSNSLKTLFVSNLQPRDLEKLPGFDNRVMRRINGLCGEPFSLERYK